MSQNSQEEIKSPCIGVCSIDDLSGLCLGCYRNIDEIKTWFDISQSEKKNLLATLIERQLQQVNFDD